MTAPLVAGCRGGGGRVLITEQFVDSALTGEIWDLLNEELYALCEEHPHHSDPAAIAAKLCIIGRTYAAQIERRRISDSEEGDYYGSRVIPMMMASDLDSRVEELRGGCLGDVSLLPRVLETHGYLTGVFRQISGQGKRSLASKYLHFHLPELFVLYDKRAVQGLRILRRRFRKCEGLSSLCDPEFSRFATTLQDVWGEVKRSFGVELTPRQLDKALLWLSDPAEGRQLR